VSAPVLETADIQGLVVRGYGPLEAASFLLLTVKDAALARAYLRRILPDVNTARVSPETFAFQVAFTAPGLRALELPDLVVASFSREFIEGMDDEVRATSVGDCGANAPAKWMWGTAQKPHVMLMIYADKPATLVHHLGVEREAFEGAFVELQEQETTTLEDNKEHFGWRDGLSQPQIEGVPRERARKKQQTSWTTPIRPGEFVLGYPNEYDCFSESPVAAPDHDPADHLYTTEDGLKDLGRNGTYLIYRQMNQDVLALWDYLAKQSREAGEDPAARAIALGAKMVGRWPGGAPLITAPERDDPDRAEDNAFRYREDSPGTRCPLGSHIRRASPRDHLADDRDRGESMQMVRKHQMIRRGRAFGPPIAKSMDPREILAARGRPDCEPPRGLHFICLVGHISRQFEFVQRAWMSSANFLGLFKDGDPIIGARRDADDANPNDEFTCQATPVRRKYKDLPQFTQVVGGAYFFLPSIRALRFIARVPA